MFQVLSHAQLCTHSFLHKQMLAHRGRQFVSRLKWELDGATPECELDQYDADGTTYCIVMNGEDHAASLRLRASDDKTMTAEVFGSLWGPVAGKLRNGFEVTRLCSSPDLSAQNRSKAIAELLLGLCRHCQVSEINHVYGVVFPTVARTIERAGWYGIQHNIEHSDVGSLALLEWPVSDFVAWQIEDRVRENVDRHEGVLMARDHLEEVALAA